MTTYCLVNPQCRNPRFISISVCIISQKLCNMKVVNECKLGDEECCFDGVFQLFSVFDGLLKIEVDEIRFGQSTSICIC